MVLLRLLFIAVVMLHATTVHAALCGAIESCITDIVESDDKFLIELYAVGVVPEIYLKVRTDESLQSKTLVELQTIRQNQWNYIP